MSADGIDRAHFVEMDFFDGDPMHLRFGFAQLIEDGDGIFFGARRDLGGVDHLDDVGQMAMFLRLFGGDAELSRADT